MAILQVLEATQHCLHKSFFANLTMPCSFNGLLHSGTSALLLHWLLFQFISSKNLVPALNTIFSLWSGQHKRVNKVSPSLLIIPLMNVINRIYKWRLTEKVITSLITKTLSDSNFYLKNLIHLKFLFCNVANSLFFIV